jgi:hypothetical protein
MILTTIVTGANLNQQTSLGGFTLYHQNPMISPVTHVGNQPKDVSAYSEAMQTSRRAKKSSGP